MEPLAKSIAISVAIQSKYGGFAPYRQLFDVLNCEQPFVKPSVDTADPTGSFIGALVLRGPDVHRLAPILKRYLNNPRELHENAPEFAIGIDWRAEPDRRSYREAAGRILVEKHLRSTPEAISLLHALAATPHDAARALWNLKPEDRTRQIRPDEVRYALAALDSDALLAQHPKSLGKIVIALLAAEARLSKTELADRADVSTKTVGRYDDALEALSLLGVDETGYRLTVSFCIGEERRDPVLPEPLETE